MDTFECFIIINPLKNAILIRIALKQKALR